jgi:hypothetical protein
MSSVPDVCRGGNGSCDCEEYQPPDPVKPGSRPTCVECDHGKSKHPKGTAPPTVAATSLDLRPMTGNQKVLQIFNAVSSRSTDNKEVTFDAARSEVMGGFRPDGAEGSAKKTKVSVLTT